MGWRQGAPTSSTSTAKVCLSRPVLSSCEISNSAVERMSWYPVRDDPHNSSMARAQPEIRLPHREGRKRGTGEERQADEMRPSSHHGTPCGEGNHNKRAAARRQPHLLLSLLRPRAPSHLPNHPLAGKVTPAMSGQTKKDGSWFPRKPCDERHGGRGTTGGLVGICGVPAPRCILFTQSRLLHSLAVPV